MNAIDESTILINDEDSISVFLDLNEDKPTSVKPKDADVRSIGICSRFHNFSGHLLDADLTDSDLLLFSKPRKRVVSEAFAHSTPKNPARCPAEALRRARKNSAKNLSSMLTPLFLDPESSLLDAIGATPWSPAAPAP